MTNAPVRKNETHPPTLWVCPKCQTKVRTHVFTYPVECRHRTHHREMVLMVPKEDTK